MSILWIYDNKIDPHVGGTERATHLIMTEVAKNGYQTAGYLVFRQDHPREINDQKGNRVDDLYEFLKGNEIHVIVNQIGYSKWLLEEFLLRGGQRWKKEGGRVITKLHFDPSMFTTTFLDLTRHWRRKTPIQKVRRLGRIALLPIERYKALRDLRQAYAYLIAESDNYIILSENHRRKLYEMSETRYPERVQAIPNPNTFFAGLPEEMLKEKHKTVLIVSRLDEPQKRISLALLSWDRVMRKGDFSDWVLQILGDGDYAEDYRELISKKRIPNVEFIGRTDPEKFYEKASLYLHTAKREGWGLTITEAMQKGVVPIVMNSSAVFEEIIDNGKNGILSEDGNVNAFSAHLSMLMSCSGERERMAVNAIETARQRDAGNITLKWLKLLA